MTGFFFILFSVALLCLMQCLAHPSRAVAIYQLCQEMNNEQTKLQQVQVLDHNSGTLITQT